MFLGMLGKGFFAACLAVVLLEILGTWKDFVVSVNSRGNEPSCPSELQTVHVAM